jgi:hypothetical protein
MLLLGSIHSSFKDVRQENDTEIKKALANEYIDTWAIPQEG